jgi:NADPH:quinone reductase-like Zn-dependent oxidoreductase
MRAIVQYRYGSPDLLRLEEVDKPTPGPGQVLVEVRASSVNSWDWDRLHGTPFVNRVLYGLRRPRPGSRILGADVAGRVEEVGSGVSRLRPGDDVFGDLAECGWGAFAEYVCVPEQVLTTKPASLTYEQAAATPQAAVLALNGLRRGRLAAGMKVLINGAGGGVGTFAIQMAKAEGAEITAVDVAAKLDVTRVCGADHAVDYTREDFTRTGQQYDLILDVAAYRSPLDIRRALAAGGAYIVIGGATVRLLQTALVGPWISWTESKKMGLLLNKANTGMEVIARSLESGTLKPVVDRVYPLEEVPDALRYFGEGRAAGKVVIRI